MTRLLIPVTLLAAALAPALAGLSARPLAAQASAVTALPPGDLPWFGGLIGTAIETERSGSDGSRVTFAPTFKGAPGLVVSVALH